MIGIYRRITVEQLTALRETPEAIFSFLHPEGGKPLISNDFKLDIDKAWHAIHFCLTGDPWAGKPPLANAVLGGTSLGDDLAYGPARFLTAEQVQDVATALNGISMEDFVTRCDFVAMNKARIYPSNWVGSPEDLKYITSYYSGVVDFFNKAARENNAMLLYIN